MYQENTNLSSIISHLDLRYKPESVQHLFASILIEELLRLGVGPFIISPGMRAVPLFMALEGPLARDSDIKYSKGKIQKILVNDERSAGFYAVGASKAGLFPCLICTSGTAVANYHPAIIEAWYSNIPLLVITTDRPWELRDAGANQTITQKDIFKDCTIQSIDLPAPDSRVHVHSLLSTLNYLIAKSRTELKPVHINLGFRKPFFTTSDSDVSIENFNISNSLLNEDLESLKRWIGCSSSYVSIKSSRSIFSADLNINYEEVSVEKSKKKVLIVSGPSHSPHWLRMYWAKRSGSSNFSELILNKARELSIPVLTDIHSNLRQFNNENVCSLHQLYLKELEESGLIPDVVLYVGDRIVSTSCQEYLEAVSKSENSKIIKFQTSSERLDAIENEFIHFTHLTPFINEAFDMLPLSGEIDTDFSKEIFKRERDFRKKLSDAFLSELTSERSYVSSLIEALPEGSKVMLSASMVFREADNYAFSIPKDVMIYGNRGATGIDGIISSGIGLGLSDISPVLIILGDQAALHDLTGLSLLKQSRCPVVIAVINNQGGAIFNIVKKESILPTLLNSHELNFKNFAEGFSVPYHKAQNRNDAKEKMIEAFNSNKHLLLEIPLDGVESAIKLNRI